MDEIRKIAYDKYKYNWSLNHHINMNDLDNIADDWFNERLTDPDYEDTFSDYLYNKGFNGMIWACFGEFIDCEYKDAAYMKALLTASEYEEYCKDIGIETVPEVVYVVQSQDSYDSVRGFTIHGICRNKDKAKEVLKNAVENSGYFDDVENPEIEEDYADTNNQDVAGADWEEISIEEMNLL